MSCFYTFIYSFFLFSISISRCSFTLKCFNIFCSSYRMRALWSFTTVSLIIDIKALALSSRLFNSAYLAFSWASISLMYSSWAWISSSLSFSASCAKIFLLCSFSIRTFFKWSSSSYFLFLMSYCSFLISSWILCTKISSNSFSFFFSTFFLVASSLSCLSLYSFSCRTFLCLSAIFSDSLLS